MKLLLLILLFFFALLIEGSVLSRLFQGAIPTISFAILVLSLATQKPFSAVWFALGAGLLRDLLASEHSISFLMLYVLLWAIIHGFMAATQFDEPLKTVLGVCVGFLLSPLAWVIVSLAQGSQPGISFSDLVSRPGISEVSFIIVTFLMFTWVSLRFFRRQRASELHYLPQR